MTVGEFVSDVKNSIRALDKDSRVSSRYIHSLAQNYTDYLLSQRPLSDAMRDSSIFTEVTCVEMERIKSDKCAVVEFRKCDKIMRTKCKLPQLYNSKVGQILISVLNITGDVEYEQLRSPADYTNTKKRKFPLAKKYYYISNENLYILGTTSELISITGLFADELEALKFSSCSEESVGECSSALDYRMIIPNKYISTVKDQVIQHILTTRQAIPEDELSNLDSNQKTRQ